MSKEEQSEPSMEEILASIRRIISEEAVEEQQAATDAGAAQLEGQGAADAPEAPPLREVEAATPVEPAPEPAPTPAPAPETTTESAADDAVSKTDADSTEEDILELTEMLDEDGNVVPLITATATPTAVEAPEASAPEPAPRTDPGLKAAPPVAPPAAQDPHPRGEAPTATASSEQAPPVLKAVPQAGDKPAPEPEAKPEPEPEPEAKPEPVKTSAPAAETKSPPAEKPEPTPAAKTAAKPEAPPPSQPKPEPVSAQPEAPAQVAQAGTEEAATQRKEEVMAEDTSAKAQENGQEKDLATAVMGAATAAAVSAVEASGAMDSRSAATQIGAGRTLETLVCEAMEPHMRAWLDENLAGLVERVVREEVSRLARRLEDD